GQRSSSSPRCAATPTNVVCSPNVPGTGTDGTATHPFDRRGWTNAGQPLELLFAFSQGVSALRRHRLSTNRPKKSATAIVTAMIAVKAHGPTSGLRLNGIAAAVTRPPPKNGSKTSCLYPNAG